MRARADMLLRADGRYYVDSYRGHDLDVRVSEHNAGVHRDAWTYRRRPVQLVWCQEFQLITDAIAVEQQMKRWRRERRKPSFAVNGRRCRSWRRRMRARAWTVSPSSSHTTARAALMVSSARRARPSNHEAYLAFCSLGEDVDRAGGNLS